jgi:hypothetical protein
VSFGFGVGHSFEGKTLLAVVPASARLNQRAYSFDWIDAQTAVMIAAECSIGSAPISIIRPDRVSRMSSDGKVDSRGLDLGPSFVFQVGDKLPRDTESSPTKEQEEEIWTESQRCSGVNARSFAVLEG